MKRLKLVSVFLVVSILISSIPFHVFAVQYIPDDGVEAVDTYVEEEVREEMSTEGTDPTSEQEDIEIISDFTDIIILEETLPELPLPSDREPDSLISIPRDQCLVLGPDGKYQIIAGRSRSILEDLTWDNVENYYDSETSVTFEIQSYLGSVTGTEEPVVIGSISGDGAGTGILSIVPGSNIEVVANAVVGINVWQLNTPYAMNEKERTKLKITTGSVGILADMVLLNNVDLDIKSGKMGISAVESTSNIPVKGHLRLEKSNVKIYNWEEKIPALFIKDVDLSQSELNIISENGTGLITESVAFSENSVVFAKSKNGINEKGIIAKDILGDGSITGIAEEGNLGIWISDNLILWSSSQEQMPSVIGEAKTGYGILMEPGSVRFTLTVGRVIGRVGEGIGLQCDALEVRSDYSTVEQSQIIGIAEKGYGICARSIRIEGNSWDVIGEAKQALDDRLFTQEWIPPVAGILVSDVLPGSGPSGLNVIVAGTIIEGIAPPEVTNSCGMFIVSSNSGNGLLNLQGNYGRSTTVKATGDIGIRANKVQITETKNLITPNYVFITAKGATTGMKVDELNIDGQGQGDASNTYRIKATSENGTGLEIISKEDQPIKIQGAGIEATGKLYGLHIEGTMEPATVVNSKIKATGLGTDSEAGIYTTANEDATTLLNVTIEGSEVIAESEKYGWLSKDCFVAIQAADDQSQDGISTVEVIGAEVGMKISVDQDKYEVDKPLLEIKGEHVRNSATLKAVAKTAIPDQAINPVLDFDKIVPDVLDDINRGVLVDCGTITEEYRTKAVQQVTDIPVWPYTAGLNMKHNMNYEWIPDSNSNTIRIEKTEDGIKAIQGSGDAKLVISREGSEDEELFTEEPIVLRSSISGASRVNSDPALHQIVFTMYFQAASTGGGGGGGIIPGGTTSTETEEPTTETTTSSEIDPETPSTSDGTDEVTEAVQVSTEKEMNERVPWNHSRPNTGDMSSQYVLSAFALVSILSSVYICILHRKKNRMK